MFSSLVERRQKNKIKNVSGTLIQNNQCKKNLNKEGLSGKKKVFLALILIDIVNKLYIWCDNDEGGGVYVCVYLYSEEGGKERNYCYFLSDTFSVPKVCVLYVFM